MRLSWLAVALVVALLLIPAAAASHNMGHRYLVHGRVLDSNGMPIQNQPLEIRLKKEGTLISSIRTSTDCLGDFDSWKGQVGFRGQGDGGGTIEGPLAIPGGQGQYVNFHFHDPDLSSLFSFELSMLNTTWTEGFDSDTRQTVVKHQLDVAGTPACGNYDEFNSTFEVRVFIAQEDEMTYRVEPTFVPRQVTVGLDSATSSGAVDFMYTYVAKLNTTGAEGSRVTIDGTDLGSKSRTVSAEEAKFRRLDSINVLRAGGGASFEGLKIFGIVVVVGAVLVGGYFGMKKMQAKREEAKLMQGSTRRRFRKERGGPGN